MHDRGEDSSVAGGGPRQDIAEVCRLEHGLRLRAKLSAMNTEGYFQIAFWALMGLMILMRVWFVSRLRPAGERLLPDRTALQREGWRIVAIRGVGYLLFAVFIVLLSLHPISLQRLVDPLPPWLRWAGFAMGLASPGLWHWTHLALGRFWSPQVQLRAVHRLVTSGPYSRMRHPVHMAILAWAVSLGFVIASWVPVLFAAWVAAILVLRVPREERMMLEQFGDECRDYMKRTGRSLPWWQTPRHAAITALGLLQDNGGN